MYIYIHTFISGKVQLDAWDSIAYVRSKIYVDRIDFFLSIRKSDLAFSFALPISLFPFSHNLSKDLKHGLDRP